MAIESISISKYIPYDSVIHRFDPRLKLLSLITGIVMAFLPTGFTGLVLMLVFVITLVPFSKLPLRIL